MGQEDTHVNHQTHAVPAVNLVNVFMNPNAKLPHAAGYWVINETRVN